MPRGWIRIFAILAMNTVFEEAPNEEFEAANAYGNASTRRVKKFAGSTTTD